MAFKKPDKSVVAGKPDRKGMIVIRIDRQAEGIDPSSNVMPAQGNLRETVLVEDATVGEVAAAIRSALFTE